MTIAIWPLLLAVAGLVLYALADKEKPKEVGRLMLAAGLIAVALVLAAGKAIHVG